MFSIIGKGEVGRNMFNIMGKEREKNMFSIIGKGTEHV